MYTTTKEKIIQLLKQKGELTPHTLSSLLGIGKVALHRHLKDLLTSNELKKLGRAPKVYYRINSQKKIQDQKFPIEGYIKNEYLKHLKNFTYLTPTGDLLSGIEAFVYWCEKRKFNINDKFKEYVALKSKYTKYKNEIGLINARRKMKDTFKQVHINNIFYIDFYSWEIFGKTMLGNLVTIAKQSQNLKYINKLINEIEKYVYKLIIKEKVDAIGFVPPSEKREIQLMKQLEIQFKTGLPTINIDKISTPIIIPQKSIAKLEDRIENARSTFAIDGNPKYQKVLIIDDAVGSGATLNEIAKKLKNRNITKEVVGLAIVGSYKGFEVISRV